MTESGPIPPPLYSARPGFTAIGGMPSQVGPVVVHIDGSDESLDALRSAADQAMTRSSGIIVLDGTGVAAESPAEAFSEVEPRRQELAAAILRNDHVEVRGDAPDPSVELYLGLGASLVIFGAGEVAALAERLDLLAALMAAPFDLMLLADAVVGAQMTSSATSEAGSMVRSQAR